jgi:N-acetylmuramoyl-L-alanine amidase
VLVPRSIRIVFLVSMLFSFDLCAEITLKYQGSEYKFNTVGSGGLEYVKLTDLLSPFSSPSMKPVYNRSVHKISFGTDKTTFILSPISNAVYAGGETKVLTDPVIMKKGVFYVSRPAVAFMAPSLSYEVSRPVVFIDPGHGGDGEDGLGAEAKLADGKKKIYEKEIALDFSKQLGNILEEKGYDIKYMRTDNDTKLSLKERIEKANSSGADVFISIHANSSATDKVAKGVDIFYMSEEAEDNYSKIVAQTENKVFEEKKADDDAGKIISSMLVDGHIKEGARLASNVSSKIPEKMMNRGVKKAPFAVLSGTTMPSILIEIGFMSNAEDLKKISSSKDMKSLATKIADGVASYISRKLRTA